MATDVARLSFDPARVYRGVVPQQGRVNLEAEQNEQRVIDIEERRKELLDIVGPAGTPDNGYAVSNPGGGFELTIGAGTMYVGGWRLELDEDLGDYSQPDWLDRPGDWAEVGREHVVLWVQDTDVTAVEDPALYEVALGGPDGAARTRLLQRILRLRTTGDDCAEALLQDRKQWLLQGLNLNPKTMELESTSRLLVTWEGDPEPANPCEPSSTGGYLGAENQCIRVQITGVGRDGTVDFVWGYDDASFLYRVSADESANPVLTLDRTPVDDFHRPRAGQAVQALVSTADLASTDGTVEGYVAALGGQVGVLAAPYDPDTKTVQFPAPLPANYTDADANPQLYLRVWEELVEGASLGKPVTLTGTGMQVTISVGRGRLHKDDFWCIGVRPATPTAVYPERYLREPQPPDGPHQWICPLAVIEWQRERLVVVEDCRNHFKPLIDIDTSGCCTIEVRPSDSGRLQELIDSAAAARVLGDRGDRVTICFEPGRYELTEPLLLRREHSNLTLRGCNEGAVITVAEEHEADFGQGMIVLLDADNVTITGFEFAMPQVPATIAHAQGSSGGVFDRQAIRAINAEITGRYVSIALRPINCAMLEVDDCLFRFSVGEHQTTLEDAQTMPRNVFGVAIFAAGGVWGLRLTRNRFLHDPTTPQQDGGPLHLLIGYLLTPTVVSRSEGTKARAIGLGRLQALIDDATITDNLFRGITAAVVVAAELGDLRIWDNVVDGCFAGVWLLDATGFASADPSGRVAGKAAAGQQAATSFFDPVLIRVVSDAMLYPLPQPGDVEHRGELHFEAAHVAELRERSAQTQQSFLSEFSERFAAEHPERPAKERAGAKAAAEARLGAERENVVLSKNMAAIWSGLAELVRLDAAPADLPAQLSVERNTLDCAVTGEDRTGPALFVFTQMSTGPTAAIGSNRLTSRRASVIVAAVLGPSIVTVTGNTVAGQEDERVLALAVAAVGAAAVTGNVVFGRTVLPENRPFPAPLDTWQPLNTFI
jgi:hypothetical protein